jgi:hypothetical protein
MDYKKAASYWSEKEKESLRLDEDTLWEQMVTFIRAHNTCALATGCDDFVRCTPIEYEFKDGKFKLFTEGGLKFKGLEGNSNVSLAIFNSYTGFGNLRGMQVTGTARLIEPFTKEYMDLLAIKKISMENLNKLPTVLYLIEITPVRIDYLSSEFKTMGFDPRQYLCFDKEEVKMEGAI